MSIYTFSEEEMRKYDIENFLYVVDRMYLKQKFDLSQSKEELKNALVKGFLDGNLKKTGDLVETIVKSYVPARFEEIKPFINFADLRVSKPYAMISKFLNEISETSSYDLKNIDQTKECLANIIVDELESACGDVIYIKKLSQNSDKLLKLKDALKKKGYTSCGLPNSLYVREKTNSQVAKNQELLLYLYKNVVNDFIKNFNIISYRGYQKEKFDMAWEIIEGFLSNAESRMSEETKTREDFLEAKKNVEKFFSKGLDNLRVKWVRVDKQGDYYSNLLSTFRNFKAGKADKTDVLNIQDFYKRVKALKVALSFETNENGEKYNFPANYFTIMPIRVSDIYSCLARLNDIQENTSAIENYDKNAVEEARRLVSVSFSRNGFNFRNENGEPIDILAHRKGIKYENKNGVVVDLTDDKKYQDFVDQVSDVLEKNNMPKTDLCVETVAKWMCKGRKPINLPDNIEAGKERCF